MKYFANSSTGEKKKQNEDRFLIKKIHPDMILFAVADGLGGQPAGHVAAQTAMQAIENFVPDSDNLKKEVEDLILKADDSVTKLSEINPKLEYMGTTLTIALSYQNTIFWAHVGDTRIYHLNANTLVQITTDQTMAQFLVEEQEITKEEALDHPMQNLLDQSLGAGDCEPETGSFHISPGDIVLLCSDGLFSEINPHQLKKILSSKNKIKKKVSLLINAANNAGGRDNITAVAIEY